MSECNTPDDDTNRFIPSMNSYYDVGKSTSYNLASQLDAGLMSVDDYCKLLTIIIPPPFITLTSNKCNTVIKGGIIGIISGDNYIKIDSSVNIKQNEDGIAPAEYSSVPLKIHGNTYGIRFSLDIDRLSSYLTRNGRLILKGRTGEPGDPGEPGIAGNDYVLSGPNGDDGLPGTTPPLNFDIQNEPIEVVDIGSTGITDIQPIINNDDTYDLIITRQPIGDVNVSTNRINIDGAETTWAVAVQGPGPNRQPYYVDLDPILNSVHSRATTYAELIKKGYEDAVKFWIQTMSDLFDSQKSALCCALDRCKSRIKNDALRRHFELTSATAKPDYKTIIKTRRDNPDTLASTGILRELYPDGDFCEDPIPSCGFGVGVVSLITTNINCTKNLYIDGTIKYDWIDIDVADELLLVPDFGQISPTTVTKNELLAGVNINFNCNAKYIDVVSTGKCVNSNRVTLPDIPENPDPLCEFGTGSVIVDPPAETPSFTLGKWRFSETNYLPIDGNTREYDQDSIPVGESPYGAMWSVIDDGYGLKASFTDSTNCQGVNSMTQFGTATVDIVSTQKESIVISWSGIGEMQDPDFEKMSLKIDGILIGSGRAAGGNLGCSMGPIVANNLFPNGYELSVGNHTIEIVVSTQDPLYHVGAFYQFTLKKANSNQGCVLGKLYTGILKYDTLEPDLNDFTLTANGGPVTPSTATRAELLNGLSIQFDCFADFIEVKSNGKCVNSDIIKITDPIITNKVETLSVDYNYETQLEIDAKTNLGYPLNGVSLQLPKGRYKVRILDTDAFINGKYMVPLRILTTRGMTNRSIDFIDKGHFDNLIEAQETYNNNTIIVDHDGGVIKAFLTGTVDDNNSGMVIIGISPLKITLSSEQLTTLRKNSLDNVVRIRNIPIDIIIDGVNTNTQTSFEFDGTVLIPTKNI